MALVHLWVNLFAGLLLSEICLRSSLAFPPKQHTQHEPLQRPQVTGSSKHPAQEQRKQVNTVRVTCHPDSMEVVIKADLFGVGAPVHGHELRLGVEHSEVCSAAASSRDEFTIVAGLVDCGTQHWMTRDSLVYTNLLIFSPAASPDGLIRMDEAVIPVECHYERKYSLSSSALAPTWIPYMSTQAAVETLEFDLRVMTDDWLYQRSSNVFYLGDPISIEASVRLGHHMGLRVFVSSCVATLNPDIYSVPRYVFIENGCLVDSQLPGSKSHFLPRIQDDKLHMVIDAFRFHNEDRGELYITCHLNAVPVNDAQAPNKACTHINERWLSADGNDYLCGYCQSQNEVEQTHNKPRGPGKFGPRGFGKLDEPEPFWRSGLKSNLVWDREARVGPMLVLPGKQKSGPLPAEEVPPILDKISRPALYGSRWRSGVNDKADLEKGLLHGPSTADQVEVQTSASEQDKDLKSDKEEKGEDAAPLEKVSLDATLKAKAAVLDVNATADINPTAQLPLDVTLLSNATATEPDPKRK